MMMRMINKLMMMMMINKLMMMMMMMKKLMNKKKKKKNNVIMSTIEQDHPLMEDLILEILSHLPPITLLRFKSVSKTWYSLISNPDFCRRNTTNYQLHGSSNHNHNHNHDDHRGHMLEEPSPPPSILLRRRACVQDSNIVIHPYPRGLDHKQKKLALLLHNLNEYSPALNESSSAQLKNETFKLADSCNGLLLYVHQFTRTKEEKREIVFYVCNPITKHHIRLPKLYKSNIAHIVFNPSFSLTYKVFTWIPCVNRRSTTSRSDSSHYYGQLYVYSSSEAARSWRLSVSIPMKEFSLFFLCDLKAVLWNGVLHWTTCLGGSTDDVLPLCYDIEKETVWKMKLPKMTTGYTHRRLLYFGLCSERLLMIEKQYKHDEDVLKNCFPCSFDVLEKQEESGEENEGMWTVRYRVDFEEVDNDFYSKVFGSNSWIFGSSIFDIYRTMRTKNEEEVVEEEVMLMKVELEGDSNHRIIFFNLTSNTFGNEKLHYRKTVLPVIDFLNYTDILRYNVTLFPP